MLINISHEKGIEQVDEILFETAFGYMLPHVHASPECFLRVGNRTLQGLNDLGREMADPGAIGDAHAELDSGIPAAYTYLGQFIDHDITARTDREGRVSVIVPDGDDPITPLPHEDVVSQLHNGRRPQLDLDSVYGDGPGLIEGVRTEAQCLFRSDHSLDVNVDTNYIDLPRDGGRARIADMRNDENVMVSQLHAAFLQFHNKVLAVQENGSAGQQFARARQLVRWAYQFVVVHDYLPRICDPAVVADVWHNGPRFFAPAASGAELFMPLEFSVAAFRFGHSMIRPFYELNGTSGQIRVDQLLEAGAEGNLQDGALKSELVVDWNFFADGGGQTQMARRIDPKIAQGLFELPFGHCDPILAHLARRNLLRGYLLHIPTGQACATAMGIVPIPPAELFRDEPSGIKAALTEARFLDRTPLWYYILKEAGLQKEGASLGAVGSRLVAETLVGLVKQDVNSYWNNCCDPAVKLDRKNPAIDVKPKSGGNIRNLTDILQFAEVF